ncbi:MAG: FMN-dependent NADH-azoreductase [Rhodobacteraceae bacterium]|nr:MAG: FMN-dependent NADH-azoreductase [Paracoccaceae bacterium]
MTSTILHIDASARRENSVTRSLTAQIISHLEAGQIIRRDLADPLPLITEDWIGANFTPADQRDDQQLDVLNLSNQLVDEISRADTLVIGLPIYNFSIPASFKAWIDLVARVGLSFQYTENGPKGLLNGKRAVIAFASGGTKIGSDLDFSSAYVRHVLGFIGISDVTFVTAEAMASDPKAALASTSGKTSGLAA